MESLLLCFRGALTSTAVEVMAKIVRIGVIGCGEIANYLACLIVGSRHPSDPSIDTQESFLRHTAKSARRLVRRLIKGTTPTATKAMSPGIAGAEIVAAADIDHAGRDSFCMRFGISGSYSDYTELLVRKDVDAVLICVPPFLHKEIAVAAVRAGKHIYCEKPMAMTSLECQEMIDAAKTANVVLQIGYVLRFSSERGRIREIILKGKLGRPVFYRELNNPSAGPQQVWVHNESTGRGPLWENSHVFDFLRYIFGEPESVVGVGLKCKPGATDAIDTFGVLVTFRDGDKALFAESYGLKGFGWNKRACRSNLCQIDVLGPKGWAQFPDRDNSQTLTVSTYGTNGDEVEKFAWSSDWGADGYITELEHFFECVRDGKPTRMPGEEGMKTILVCEATAKSILGQR
jgi:predicted dehydrogenase